MVDSPYSYKSGLEEEQLHDDILKAIMKMCHVYLRNVDEFKEDYTSNHVFVAHKFIQDRMKDIQDAMIVFNNTPAYTPLTTIGHNMDLVTLAQTLKGFDSRSITETLKITLTSTIEVLKMCDSVLHQIIYTKRKTNDN